MKKLIELLNESFEDGYLKIDSNIPLYSQGNILEWTGQLLVFLEDEELIKRIVEGLKENEVVAGLVPRTVYIGAEDPHVVAEEDKKDIWEKYKDIEPRNNDETNDATKIRVKISSLNKEDITELFIIGWESIWYRTDVSHSQFTFLAIGLWMAHKRINVDSKRLEFRVTRQARIKSYELLAEMINRWGKNNHKIKRIDGKIARQGSFRWPGNSWLRLTLLDEIRKDLRASLTFSFREKFGWVKRQLLKANLYIMKKRKLNINSEDDRNTAFLLFFLDQKTDKIKEFFMKYYMNLVTVLDDQNNVIKKKDVDNLSIEQQINVYVVRYILKRLYPHFLDVSDYSLKNKEMNDERN